MDREVDYLIVLNLKTKANSSIEISNRLHPLVIKFTATVLPGRIVPFWNQDRPILSVLPEATPRIYVAVMADK